jgi:DNA repair exonuclease SbcCD ATPase subunit
MNNLTEQVGARSGYQNLTPDEPEEIRLRRVNRQQSRELAAAAVTIAGLNEQLQNRDRRLLERNGELEQMRKLCERQSDHIAGQRERIARLSDLLARAQRLHGQAHQASQTWMRRYYALRAAQPCYRRLWWKLTGETE